MLDDGCLVVTVKLDFWDAYRRGLTIILLLFRKLLRILALVIGLVTVLLVLASFRQAPPAEWTRILENLKPFLLFIGVFFGFLLVVPAISAEKALRGEKAESETPYRFSDTGVHINSRLGTADLQWRAFPKVIETYWAFVLFSNTNMGHVIPKKFFGNDADVKAMRELLRNHIPGAQLRRA